MALSGAGWRRPRRAQICPPGREPRVAFWGAAAGPRGGLSHSFSAPNLSWVLVR